MTNGATRCASGAAAALLIRPTSRRPALVDPIAAVRAGKVCLLADGDRTLGFAEVTIPPGLLRGRWRVRVARDGEEWVRSIDPSGRLVVEPTYSRPRFAAMKTPAVGKKEPRDRRPPIELVLDRDGVPPPLQ